MANDIPVGLRVPAQVPLDDKTYKINEAALQDLGVDNTLAYTYHKGLRVLCIEERTIYEWKEMEVGDVGLLPSDFVYPNGVVEYGVDYSNKAYNFVIVKTELPPLELIDEGNGIGIIIRDRDAANYGSVGLNAVDLSFSDSPSAINGATSDYTFSVGFNNVSSNQGATTFGTSNIASGGTAIAGGNNCQATHNGTVALGNFSIASGGWSAAVGNGLKARSFGEMAVGAYNTDYTPLDVNGKNPLDRAFVVGNGGASFFPSDAFIVLKNGLATLPSVTNALITADSGKAIITKEYLTAVGDTNALHKTGGESFTGVKSSTNASAGLGNGIQLINNGSGQSFIVDNNSTGSGQLLTNTNTGNSIRIDNNNTGKGIAIFNVSTGRGIDLSNSGTGVGFTLSNQNTGIGLSISNTTSGTGLLVAGGASATGFNYVGQNNTVNTFTVDKLGNITGNTFVKTGGTSSQYLMADGSVSTASAGIQSVIITGGWAINQGYVVDTTIGTGKTIISITSTLICTVANNGYSIGDIVTISPTQANDSGGLADSGVSVRYRADTSDRFTFNVNDRIDIPNCYNGGVGTSGAITDPISASSAQWNMRHVILYI